LDDVGEAGAPLIAALGDAGDADTVDNLFLVSTADVLDGLEIGVVRLVVAPASLDVVLDTDGLTAGFGLDALVGVAAFRTVVVDESPVPRFSANVSALAGECVVAGAREVLRAAAASGFLVSSPDPPTDGRDLCVEVAEVAGVAALLAGFRTASPPTGRVGGLLRPPVVLAAWAVEDAVGFVAEDVDAVTGRLAVVVVGRFGAIFSCFVPFAAFLGVAGFLGSVSASGAIVVVSLPDRMSMGDPAGGTWGDSASAMV
jgi:hypothetical protein